MNRLLCLLACAALPLAAQDSTIAVVGLVHSHVWGHLGRMIKGETAARLAGIAEANPELAAEAKKLGAAGSLIFSDYRRMLDQVKPRIVEACAPRKIHVMFEKPLAASYKEALAIRRLARKHGIQVLTNYQMAWWPANYAAKAQADSGVLGRVWRLRGIVGHGGPGSQGPRSKHFFAWLTDPVQNGAGALMDFGCYNALWSLWYMGRPESVFAQVNHLRPETFPRVEDNATLILSYKNGVGLLEASWDLPRGFQDLEVFGLKGSVSMRNGKVEVQQGREPSREIPLQPLAPEQSDPVAYMVHCVGNGRPPEGLTALDINVGVVEIIEAAKESVKSGRAVRLPSAGR